MLPLYDEIVAKMDGKETRLDKSHCVSITRLNQEHLDIIYLLVLHHYKLDNPDKNDFPYGCRTISNGKGVTFRKLDQLPEEIQKIIYRYLMIVSDTNS